MLSRNFRVAELACPCCKECKVDPKLITKLQALRDALSAPLVVTSGFRCAEHNSKVGGKPRSKHILGQAVDISIKGWNGAKKHKLLKLAFSFGFGGVGVGSTFVHLDVREKEAVWVY